MADRRIPHPQEHRAITSPPADRPRVTSVFQLGERLKELSASRGENVAMALAVREREFNVVLVNSQGEEVASIRHPTDIEHAINTLLAFVTGVHRG